MTIWKWVYLNENLYISITMPGCIFCVCKEMFPNECFKYVCPNQCLQMSVSKRVFPKGCLQMVVSTWVFRNDRLHKIYWKNLSFFKFHWKISIFHTNIHRIEKQIYQKTIKFIEKSYLSNYCTPMSAWKGVFPNECLQSSFSKWVSSKEFGKWVYLNECFEMSVPKWLSVNEYI